MTPCPKESSWSCCYSPTGSHFHGHQNCSKTPSRGHRDHLPAGSCPPAGRLTALDGSICITKHNMEALHVNNFISVFSKRIIKVSSKHLCNHFTYGDTEQLRNQEPSLHFWYTKSDISTDFSVFLGKNPCGKKTAVQMYTISIKWQNEPTWLSAS